MINAGAFNSPGLPIGALWAVKADCEADAPSFIRRTAAYPPSNSDFSIAAPIGLERLENFGLSRTGDARPL